MKILTPIELTSYTTNVTENDYAQWDVGTTYTIGQRVIVLSEHAIYESLANSNVGNIPLLSPAYWAYVSKTNAYKAIDSKVSTMTINSETLTFEFPTSTAIAIAFLNVECKNIKVEILESENVVWEEEREGTQRDSSTYNWYDYFFSGFVYVNEFVFEHPYRPSGTYRITLNNPSGVCKVGVMVSGKYFFVGNTTWGAKLGFNDYSKKETDEWGETYLKVGNFSDYFNGEILVDTPRLPIIRKVLREIRGKASLFITETNTSLYGWCREPELVWETQVKSIITFDIQGLI